MRVTTLSIITALSLGSACATTTSIVSEPPGATVTSEKDKKELGKTPLRYESKMWIWESEKLSVKAPGRKAKTVDVKRSEVDVLPMVGGVCLSLTGCGIVIGLPIILAGGMMMPAETKVALDKEDGGAPITLAPTATPAETVAMGY